MYRYILKRLIMMIPVLLGVTFIIFTIMNSTPGDVATIILGPDAPIEAREQLNKDLGLDKPFFERFFKYINDALHGDFGRSYRTARPVFEEVFSRFPTTLKLSLLGIVTATTIGVSIGVLSAVKQYSIMDITSTVGAMFMAAVPTFWLGLMMMYLFSLKLGWLPSNGIGSVVHYIMPTVALMAPPSAEIMRLTRSTMLETIRQDYIRTARSKGTSERTIIFKHALKNALLPVITSAGLNFGMMLGGAVIIEAVFVLPGLGTLMVNSVRMKDTPVVMATVIMFSILFSFIMLVVDLIYAFIDPRIKGKYLMEV